jgi:hypothetical protein
MRALPPAVLSPVACAACLIMAALLTAARPDPDPFVLLDAAKLAIGAGDLQKGADELAAIPLGVAEPYVDEEVVLQQLLLQGARLTAVSAIADELKGSEGAAATPYAKWLADETAAAGAEYAKLATDYLNRTAAGPKLTFVRFRLPRVSDEYLQDAQLLCDPAVLHAAMENWAEGRDLLGRGLVTAQARLALVISAAVHYDLPYPSPTLEQAAERLRSGVPLKPGSVEQWIAETAERYGAHDAGLQECAHQARARLHGAAEHVPPAPGNRAKNNDPPEAS